MGKRRLFWIVLVILGLIAGVFWRRPPLSVSSSPLLPRAGTSVRPNVPMTTPPASEAETPIAAAQSSRASRAAAPNPTLPAPADGVVVTGVDAGRERIELDKVNRMITDYRTLMGQNPVGTNAEIMAAIRGANPRHATLGPPEGQELNAEGELLDAWGTPLFFHQLSGQLMEIHSAGPDRSLGTKDDVVWR